MHSTGYQNPSIEYLKLYKYIYFSENYLDLQEEMRVHEETMDFKKQREEVCKTFAVLQRKLVELLEENIAEIPLHQLPLSEFNLHHEAKRERIKQVCYWLLGYSGLMIMMV